MSNRSGKIVQLLSAEIHNQNFKNIDNSWGWLYTLTSPGFEGLRQENSRSWRPSLVSLKTVRTTKCSIMCERHVLSIHLSGCLNFFTLRLLYRFSHTSQGSQDSSSGKNRLPTQMILTCDKSTFKPTITTFMPNLFLPCLYGCIGDHFLIWRFRGIFYSSLLMILIGTHRLCSFRSFTFSNPIHYSIALGG